MEQVKFIGQEAEGLAFALSGDIDLSNAEAFYAEVVARYNESPAKLIFDCRDLSFIDSTTLGTFVKILKLTKQDGYSLRLINLQPKIKKLFLICSR